MGAAAVNRITSGPIDPDLEAALPELAFQAKRLRQLEGLIADPKQSYEKFARMRAERYDVLNTFRLAAEKHAIKGEAPTEALLLIVEEADRLYDLRKRKRPTLAQVLDSLASHIAAVERAAISAKAEARLAQGAAREAVRHALATHGAVAYLEACR